MNRREFLGCSGLGVLAFCGHARVAEMRPNILVLMADDLGYSDLSCFGSKEIKTPVLDQLAAEGMRFTDFHAAAPNCSPSRTAMLTGRFPARASIYSYVPPESVMHLRRSEMTSAALLKGAGYATAHVGKWHLRSGLAEGKTPTPGDHGFDYWFATENNALPSHKDPVNFVRNGKPVGAMEGYSAGLVAEEAIGWLKTERKAEQPFFLNVWFHEPHRKVAAPKALRDRHKGQKDPAYLACVENMDAAIGRILAQLDALGLAENTLVLFTSDNGSYREGSNGAFRGAKSHVYEGGHRAPTIVRWPGRVAAGSTCDTVASGVDVLPTLCSAAGIDGPQDRVIDGVDLTPLFRGEDIQRKKPLFWFFYRTDPACALRDGDWSLIGYLNENPPEGHAFQESHMRYVERATLERFELFNLKDDPTQSKDVSCEHPTRFESLKAKMVALHAEVVQEGYDWYPK